MNTQEEHPGFEWMCYGCGATAPLSEPFTCPHCGTPRSLRPAVLPPEPWPGGPPLSMWDYFDLLPVEERARVVSIGEGATPLVEAPRLAAHTGLGRLWLKNETANPTGSFKDRQVSVGVSHAREQGMETISVVSSGNVACAAAAYAARAGIRAVLFMHGQAGAGKIAQAAAYGATVICVDSPSPAEVFRLCLDACKRWGWYHCSTAGIYEPYNVEGAKTIAYELYRQFGGALPDYLVAPVGGGGLLGGVWRGFLDLMRMGLVEKPPRLAGVQAAGCAPLKKAVDEGTPFLETLEHPWPNPKTVAGGIADDILFDGHTVLPAVRKTDGMAVAVDDPEIIAAMHRLAAEEGVLCELTAAVVPAALEAVGKAAPGASVCALITGSGIKELPWLAENAPEPHRIPPSLDALEAVL